MLSRVTLPEPVWVNDSAGAEPGPLMSTGPVGGTSVLASCSFIHSGTGFAISGTVMVGSARTLPSISTAPSCWSPFSFTSAGTVDTEVTSIGLVNVTSSPVLTGISAGTFDLILTVRSPSPTSGNGQVYSSAFSADPGPSPSTVVGVGAGNVPFFGSGLAGLVPSSIRNWARTLFCPGTCLQDALIWPRPVGWPSAPSGVMARSRLPTVICAQPALLNVSGTCEPVAVMSKSPDSGTSASASVMFGFSGSPNEYWGAVRTAEAFAVPVRLLVRVVHRPNVVSALTVDTASMLIVGVGVLTATFSGMSAEILTWRSCGPTRG